MGWLLYVVITIMSSYLVVNDNEIIVVIIISDHDIINHNVLHEWGFPNSWGVPQELDCLFHGKTRK